MKTKVLISLLTAMSFAILAKAQTTAIPDANFEDYLETHSEDGSIVNVGDAESMGDGITNNGLVLTERINAVVLLDVSNLGIDDLTGIEDFTALEILFCSENNLTVLNISNNTNLISLVCGSNSLTVLDISNNSNLETLDCSNNQIQNLDVINNTALRSISASDNQLAQIDLSNNTELRQLNISDNRIVGELVVVNNANLKGLFCSSNQIDTLDLNANSLINNLDVSNNILTNLDLTSINSIICPDPQTDPETDCQSASQINVSRNNLVSLNVNNGFNDLVSLFDASDNPDLFCIQIDNGFTPEGWVKDDWTYFSDAACVDIFTYVPDDNFEQALIDAGLDDTLDNLVLTENINVITDLDIANSNITSLLGIQDFIQLQNLNCSTNSIENVDLSNNVQLVQLDITNNDLENLDLSSNTQLLELYCGNNFIESLNLTNNIALTILNCSNNILSSLDVSGNTLLADLDASFNQIEQLDVSALTSMVSFLANDNNLFAINMANGNNTIITTFDATNNNSLFCIEVDDAAYANGAAGWQKDAMADYNLNCGTYIPDDNFEQYLIDQNIDSDGTLNNFVSTADIVGIDILNIPNLAIADLTGIEDFTALEDLNVSNNALTSLNLSSNVSLQTLNCSSNNIEQLDLTANAALISLTCNTSNLSRLNIASGNNNNLADFNAQNNPTLFCITVDNAVLGNIPATWQIDGIADYNDDCENNRFTAIPDPFFEQALIDLGHDDVIDGLVLTSAIETLQILEVGNKSIQDLTGIQDFRLLVELDCSSNFLEALDISNMLFLERLNCSSNFLQTNDINGVDGVFNSVGTPSLRELFCADNNLNDLDTSQNLNLEILDCANNNLAQLQIDNNALLRRLNCSNNDLDALDISNNLVLKELNADSNRLTALTTATIPNTSLTELSCANNELSTILVNNYQGLETLNCSSNELTALNVSANPGLTFLSLTNNQITNIDLSANLDLDTALLSQNELSTLDVTSNTVLNHLNCSFNAISALELNTNTVLTRLYASSNQLNEADLSANASLIDLDVSSNQITQFTLSNDLSVLKVLNVSNNQIEGPLDLTTMALSACTFQPGQNEFCPETISINLSNNLFDFVNLQNGINPDIASLNTTGNPNLECIQVDDENSIGAGWLKDEDTSYSVDCNFGETFVPDDNFEQALIDLGLDTAPLNDFVLTSNIQGLTNLDISGNGIADLAGIEDFENLETLNVSNNNLIDVDLSNNIALLNLNISGNQLTELQLENNTQITALNTSGNALSALDLSQNQNLLDLNIADNAFTAFIPADVLSLEVFACENNEITELNFQENQAIISIDCSFNMLEILNIRNGQNAILANLNAQNNPNLLCIESDNGTVPNGSNWLIDSTAQLSTECFFGQTFVPDDNFEQALIDLGYDSGPLDDYVFTGQIEDLVFLDVSGREISDLTGIEAFLNLTTLNIQNNALSTLDLSNNLLLNNLNASENMLTNIDVSILTELTDLDLGSNQISQINLNNNFNLIDVDISNNALTQLNVDALINLEELICASNQLSALDVTQNTSLRLLFCQSNQLIADQLNLQNGNNENLQLFNATNNPSLSCILVDDPVAVINNVDGFYDNWFKDETSSYQTICADADNDGIPNEDDQCPNTPFGAAVDLFGCAIPDLPSDNFTVSVTSETCLNSNNGQITIIGQELYAYTATLISDDFYQEYNFTNDIDIFNLLAGTYSLCITIEEWPDYEICYTIVITQPEPLEVFSNRMASGDEISLALSGSSKYHIELNGETFTTYNPALVLQLQNGINDLKVKTDLDCQGIYEERILVSQDALFYPNPVKDILTIYYPAEDEDIQLYIYSPYGQLLRSKTIKNIGSEVYFDMSPYASGIYVISVQSKSMISTQKIIKE
ncbi:leucine-rich repeat domain-containing protein [Winogradskyella sp. DF17]|uniref:Leucine-rich repeat domain-containing protein n=1 Tax=Winogradskyella pelagia TaxID=2819984 RepID=A0ABS3T1W7_9FLAO|nr:leucine-rich repeat domain-containing protein [Winogradskyella sp. DF17]MBO3116743.1 leucine-rich repeat domain-containing protein [Winogradskyella sp. DF17]